MKLFKRRQEGENTDSHFIIWQYKKGPFWYWRLFFNFWNGYQFVIQAAHWWNGPRKNFLFRKIPPVNIYGTGPELKLTVNSFGLIKIIRKDHD